MLAIVPEEFDTTEVEVHLESDGERSESVTLTVGRRLADDMHIVANPAVDPKDDSVILTRSGSRGQKLPVTLFRLSSDGFLDEMPADVLNPTGVAFDPSGTLFVTNRSDGEVVRVEPTGETVPYVTGLGIATGIAFDADGVMHVGDRGGTVYKVSDFGSPEALAVIEPSVSAYHMAFGPDGVLYVTAPGLSSYDSVYSVDAAGFDTKFFSGLGRPQGLAFDTDGNLYVAACHQGRRGVIRISPDGETAEPFIAGSNVIGLCFNRKGEVLVATNEALYAVPVGIRGTLLPA